LQRVVEVAEFGIRLYTLTHRRVSVSFARVSFAPEGTTVKIHPVQYHLPHFVHDVAYLSIETYLPATCEESKNCSDAKSRKAKKKKEFPQRIFVAGDTEFEVLLLCPKKTQPENTWSAKKEETEAQ
ncbi:hypothetical protein PFISCL1PPCAC_20804, partial [Pristionchus fissidentatus]